MFTAPKIIGAATKGVLGFVATAIIDKEVDKVVSKFDPNAVGNIVKKVKAHF